MDHFERELARLMRDGRSAGQDDSPYEDRHRRRLYAGVRARQRTRRAWMATGSALTIAALGAVLLTLPNSFAQNGPTAPRPATSAEPIPTRSTAEGSSKPAFTSNTVPAASPHRTPSTHSSPATPSTSGNRTT